MDPEQQAYGLEAEKYHQVAKAALFQTAMTDDPTLNAVQAVVSWHPPFTLRLLLIDENAVFDERLFVFL